MIYRLSAATSTMPHVRPWLQLLAGKTYSWRHAFFTTDVFVQGQRFQTNPTASDLCSTPGMIVEILQPDEPPKTSIIVKEFASQQAHQDS